MPAIQLSSISDSIQTSASQLVKRQYGYYNGYYGYGNSNWYDWGRWVLLGCIIAAAIIIFFLISCLQARRRRKHGATPMYGTAWMAPQHGAVNYYGPNGQNTQQSYYNPGQNGYNNDYAPPAYPANGYGQQNGIELQQPQQAYTNPQRGGEETYAPPEGPPPKKRGLFK